MGRGVQKAGFQRKRKILNRSGIPIKPLYTQDDWSEESYTEKLGYPGQIPMTRGIYPSMHRGRMWSQRQLIGFGVPANYNERLLKLLDAGSTAVSLIPCNSVYRGYDADEVDPKLLGTCGVVVNTIDDMDRCFRDVDIAALSTAMNDPLPFTLLALLLGVARRRGVDWSQVSGTSNQSDYISHYVANHMFFRLSLTGSRRVLVDHIAFCQQHVPNWNPLSVVGQHTQQAGATPAQSMAFTLATAIQFAEDCIERGLDPEQFSGTIYLLFRSFDQFLRGNRQMQGRTKNLAENRAGTTGKSKTPRRGDSNSTVRLPVLT